MTFLAPLAFGALLTGIPALTAEGATLTGALGAAATGGLMFQGVDNLVREGINYIKNQSGADRKQPETSELQDNTDINNKTSSGERKLLMGLIKKK